VFWACFIVVGSSAARRCRFDAWSVPPASKRRSTLVPGSVIGGRWKPVLVCHRLGGRKWFGELGRLTPSASERIITLQLRALEADGVIARHVHAEVPPRVEYEVTEFGRSLEPVLVRMQEWGRAFKARRLAEGARRWTMLEVRVTLYRGLRPALPQLCPTPPERPQSVRRDLPLPLPIGPPAAFVPSWICDFALALAYRFGTGLGTSYR